jgi:hypothetical protein
MARHISLRLRCTLQDGVMAVFEDGYLLGTVDYKATPTEITEQTRLLWEASGGWTRAAIQNMSIATYHIVKVAAEEPDDQRNLRAMLAWSGAVNIEVEGDGPDEEPAAASIDVAQAGYELELAIHAGAVLLLSALYLAGPESTYRGGRWTRPAAAGKLG